MIMKILKRIKYGLSHSAGSAQYLALFVLLGVLAGLKRQDASFTMGIAGGLIMLVVFGPMWLYGVYDKGKEIERQKRKK